MENYKGGSKKIISKSDSSITEEKSFIISLRYQTRVARVLLSFAPVLTICPEKKFTREILCFIALQKLIL